MVSLLSRLSEILKRQQQIEDRLNQIEIVKTVTVTPASAASQAQKSDQPAPAVKPQPAVSKPDIAVFENQARELVTQAREDAFKIREEASKIKEDALKLKNEALAKEADVDRKLGSLEERDRQNLERKTELDKRIAELDEIREKQLAKLEKIATITRDEAKKLILDATEKRMSDEVGRRIRQAEDDIRIASEQKAREILIDAMKHGAVDYTAEYTVSALKLPDEEMKGRIIGKEGRNIRAFEVATGVEVELDETLDIRLSSFDPIRREVAKRSLEKLIKDGRIQPQRIEEIVTKTKSEVDHILLEEGEKLCHATKVYNLHPDLVKMLGRYKFRFSYGQNMIIHTLEETQIGVAIASELKADIAVVRLACLLHDIGKIVTDEDGNHIQLGVDLLKKYRIPEKVVNCVAEHHEDKPFSSSESAIVWIADAISGSRPGARYEPHGDYVKRMQNIEEIAHSFAGVGEVAAYQAGREVRLIIEPDKVSDTEMVVLTDKIAQKLNEEAKWAGQIKVTAIRETRVVSVAH